MFEPEELMARIVDLEEQLKVSEMAPPAAEQLISCLEGEIAKRDAKYQRDVYGLNNEGDPIGGDPAGGYANDNMRLRAELAAIKAQEPVAYISGCYRDVIDGKSDRTPLGAELAFVNMGWIGQIPLYAAPVSEAKAQDTVGEVVGWYRLDRPYEMTSYPSVCATWHKLGAPVAPLYAAPAQQVSVPDTWLVEALKENNERVNELHVMTNKCRQLVVALWRLRECLDPGDYMGELSMHAFIDEALSSAQAAPAADAGLVEALDYQVLFDAIAAATSVYANGAINISVQAFRESLASHRAKGVV